MIFVWIMFYCMKRKHYNKASLVWISNILFWKENNKKLYQTIRKFLSATDEYPVENTHSIIRAQTKDGDTPDLLQKRAKAVFQSKKSQHNFRSQFTPPKDYTFTQNQLQSLKIKGAKILTNLFKVISDNQSLKNHGALDKFFLSMLAPVRGNNVFDQSARRVKIIC